MGQRFVVWYKNLSKNIRLAFFTTFIVGFLVHIFKFTNTLPNHDSLYNYYGTQNTVGLGRWFLTIACGVTSYFDLPWVNGLLAIFWISITAMIIVDILKVQNPILITIIGSLLVAFPAISETFLFGFTADGYMLAMLFAALAVRMSLLGDDNKVHRIIAIVMVCLSCGIYQAYVSFAMVLSICYFSFELLEKRHSLKKCVKWIKNQLLVYIFGLVIYYVIWKICMVCQNVQASSYQGVDNVGEISVSLIFSAIKRTFKAINILLLEWNVIENGWTLYGVLNAIFVVFALGIILRVIKKSEIYKQKIQFVFFVLCIIAMPFAVCIWFFTSDTIVYRPMMMQSVCIVFIWIALLYERWSSQKWKDIVGTLLIIIVFNCALQANIGYFYLNKCYEETYAIGAEMMARIHLLEEGETDSIVVVGDLTNKVNLSSAKKATQIPALAKMLEEHFMFDHIHTVLFLKNTFNMDLEIVDQAEVNKWEELEEVQKMKSWPDADSVKVIDNTVVIKLSED